MVQYYNVLDIDFKSGLKNGPTSLGSHLRGLSPNEVTSRGHFLDSDDTGMVSQLLGQLDSMGSTFQRLLEPKAQGLGFRLSQTSNSCLLRKYL